MEGKGRADHGGEGEEGQWEGHVVFPFQFWFQKLKLKYSVS